MSRCTPRTSHRSPKPDDEIAIYWEHYSPLRYNNPMTRKTVGRRRTLGLLTLVLIVGALVSVTTPAEATRTMPDFVTAFEPGPPAIDLLAAPETPADTFALFGEEDVSLLAALSLLDASEIEHLSAENRFRFFADEGASVPGETKLTS